MNETKAIEPNGFQKFIMRLFGIKLSATPTAVVEMPKLATYNALVTFATGVPISAHLEKVLEHRNELMVNAQKHNQQASKIRIEADSVKDRADAAANQAWILATATATEERDTAFSQAKSAKEQAYEEAGKETLLADSYIQEAAKMTAALEPILLFYQSQSDATPQPQSAQADDEVVQVETAQATSD